jgi:hypothetical protein
MGGYARGGFALEFDESELDELAVKEVQKHANLRIKTDTVAYEKHEERAHLEKFEGLAKAIVREMAAKTNHDISDLTGKQPLDTYFAPFVEGAPFLKDPSFQEESEYRLVAVCYRPKVEHSGPCKKIDFKTRSNNTIVPYVELFHGWPDKLPTLRPSIRRRR